jgi:hypothetical protein
VKRFDETLYLLAQRPNRIFQHPFGGIFPKALARLPSRLPLRQSPLQPPYPGIQAGQLSFVFHLLLLPMGALLEQISRGNDRVSSRLRLPRAVAKPMIDLEIGIFEGASLSFMAGMTGMSGMGISRCGQGRPPRPLLLGGFVKIEGHEKDRYQAKQ